jgi:hypothetical protein
MRKSTAQEPIKNLMNDFCDQAGCSKQERISHAWKWELKRWHAHPLPSFVAWWRPDHFDEVSGAHVGGHPNAHRRWSRKEAGGWRHKWYGVSCADAWNTARYVRQFDAWQSAGSPEKPTPFVSVATDIERQKQFWHDLKGVISQIGKPMPAITEGDVALEATTTRTMPDP